MKKFLTFVLVLLSAIFISNECFAQQKVKEQRQSFTKLTAPNQANQNNQNYQLQVATYNGKQYLSPVSQNNNLVTHKRKVETKQFQVIPTNRN